ncbi:MAG: hypothetical protein A3F09_02300 [Chlamydiae bacterium RIFCSPHIGHO2_12_FULL_49_11]|nr:MAG: hypothetical protein A3F09_02300 [Chlamydiae bacterium RIFCSPHIGHO2_12_FULL_49_11]
MFFGITFLHSDIYSSYLTKLGLEHPAWGGSYLNPEFSRFIKRKEVKKILEIGSRDAVDAMILSFVYKAEVAAFECNPEAIQRCRENLRKCKKKVNVTLVPKACWHETGRIPFYPVISDTYGGEFGGKINIGASSCFHVKPNTSQSRYRQSEIYVDAIALEDWLKESGFGVVDLICMDAQGAELEVLRGMGEALKSVKYIITEAEMEELFLGEALYPEIATFLEQAGFIRVLPREIPSSGFCDVLFVNSKNPNYSSP